jgi:hypothetical protein
MHLYEKPTRTKPLARRTLRVFPVRDFFFESGLAHAGLRRYYSVDGDSSATAKNVPANN